MEKLQTLVKHSGLVAMCLIALSSGLALGYSMCIADMLLGTVIVTFVGLALLALIALDANSSGYATSRLTSFSSVAVTFLFSIFLGIGTFFLSVEPPTVIDPNPEMALELQQCKASIVNAQRALR